MYFKMMHGKEADNLAPMSHFTADSICQELIKQQGSKSQAPIPSLQGRITAISGSAEMPIEATGPRNTLMQALEDAAHHKERQVSYHEEQI